MAGGNLALPALCTYCIVHVLYCTCIIQCVYSAVWSGENTRLIMQNNTPPVVCSARRQHTINNSGLQINATDSHRAGNSGDYRYVPCTMTGWGTRYVVSHNPDDITPASFLC